MMQRPTLLTSVGVAVVISLFAAVLFAILYAVVEPRTAARLTVLGSGYAYLLYLLLAWCGRARAMLVLLLSSLTLVVVHWLSSGLLVLACTIVGWIWIARSLRVYRSPLLAMVDLGLCAFSAGLAVRVGMDTGEVVLAVWCFLLGQSLWVLLPERLLCSRRGDLSAGARFDMAVNAAVAAVAQLRERDARE